MDKCIDTFNTFAYSSEHDTKVYFVFKWTNAGIFFFLFNNNFKEKLLTWVGFELTTSELKVSTLTTKNMFTLVNIRRSMRECMHAYL